MGTVPYVNAKPFFILSLYYAAKPVSLQPAY